MGVSAVGDQRVTLVLQDSRPLRIIGDFVNDLLNLVEHSSVSAAKAGTNRTPALYLSGTPEPTAELAPAGHSPRPSRRSH